MGDAHKYGYPQHIGGKKIGIKTITCYNNPPRKAVMVVGVIYEKSQLGTGVERGKSPIP